MAEFGFWEFFAGGGMARLGLGDAWNCLFANDIDAKKGATYRANFQPAAELIIDDIRTIAVEQLPAGATLAWASFPCQDLSLAGFGKGLKGDRSGAFWPFWRLMSHLKQRKEHPPIIVIENVAGLITSHKGQDLHEIISVMVATGYRVGAIIIDAVHFVPQSRPRLFLVAIDKRIRIPARLCSAVPQLQGHPANLIAAVTALPDPLRKMWVWWKLPYPPLCSSTLLDIIEDVPFGVNWHKRAETAKILSLMSPTNVEKVMKAKESNIRTIGTIYKRMRVDEHGQHVQRAEVRFDGISGCLRTPAGGSSRQTIIVVHGDEVRTRLISTREAARLMGLPETYRLPQRYNDAYHLIGDGLAVPVVSWLERHLLNPLAQAASMPQKAKERKYA